jgi:hypothetical protein
MANINSFYHQHAMQFSTISEDGMVVTMPSEKKADVSYNIYCKETAHGIEAVDCQCRGFKRYQACKHLTIVNEWLDAQAPVAPVVEQEPKITEIEPNAWYILESNTQVWKDQESGEWLAAGLTENAIEIVEAHIAKQQAIAEAEQIVATPVVAMPVIEIDESSTIQPIEPAKIAASDSKKLASILAEQKVDLGLIGSLTRNHGFQLLR